MKRLLIIGHTFPEPATTAAGSRMMQLIELFSEASYSITFASTATPSEKAVVLSTLGIATENIKLNDDGFDVFLQGLKPSVVLFDRYITEEQFGWRVWEHCREALRILDTQDLHFLRKAREMAIKEEIPADEADLFTGLAKRELASILRCDLSLIISEVEMKLLQKVFSIPSAIIYYLPFLIETVSEDVKKALLPFEARTDFMTIGSMLHAPNADSVFFLKETLWPLIRERLPEARVHVYGAYATEQLKRLHDEKSGFLMEGWAEDAGIVMQKARVCLAPLRFGAGLKGKLIDAMVFGTPSVTSPIGGEGMYGELPYPGNVAKEVQELGDASVALYTQKELWQQAQQNGFRIIEMRFNKKTFSEAFKIQLQQLQKNIRRHREKHFIGQILQHHSLQSTRYLSKWIGEKNRKD